MEEEIDSGFDAPVISSVITPLPIPPTSKEPSSFEQRADEFLESLPRFGEELNSVGEQINEFYRAFFPKAERESERIVQECEKEAQKVAGQIEQIKEDAKREISSTITASSGRLKESANSTYLLALSVREIVIKNRRNYERVGEVKEFRGIKVPSGYVKLPTILNIIDYPLLYRALGTKRESGSFEILGKENQIIYTGKGD
ncbi:hypothetical protein [Helicobacter cholecystus]|uniref:hypothetical protein n=1 Tax=Helicobacter cholecystus TaxID=45498 RepID=UPI0027397A3A|nr:hypothetical protein [Helicobacter cholecystus]